MKRVGPVQHGKFTHAVLEAVENKTMYSHMVELARYRNKYTYHIIASGTSGRNFLLSTIPEVIQWAWAKQNQSIVLLLSFLRLCMQLFECTAEIYNE
jgi:hypothetical protein